MWAKLQAFKHVQPGWCDALNGNRGCWGTIRQSSVNAARSRASHDANNCSIRANKRMPRGNVPWVLLHCQLLSAFGCQKGGMGLCLQRRLPGVDLLRLDDAVANIQHTVSVRLQSGVTATGNVCK